MPRNKIEVDKETRARRERGRQSQAAFRKRQAKSNQDLKSKNHQLIRSIERILDCIQGDERPELLDAVSDMARTAGVSTSREGRQSLEDNLLINWHANTLVAGGKEESNGKSLLPYKSPKAHYNGMLLDPLHYLGISRPPEDVVPYLGAGSYTFAGRLFWSMLDHSQGRCDDHHEEPMEFHQRILGHSQAMEGVSLSFAQTMVKARLQLKHAGYTTADISPAAESDLAMVICTKVQQEYDMKGDNVARWLSCQAVEKHIHEILGGDSFTRLQGAFLESGCSFTKKVVKKLHCKLFDTFVCFGDGPRWTVDTVNELVFEWIMWAFEAT
ncbi:unnamed protein product [Clonostachys rosea]|uniref:BZIP domain-containing protein n=1 Tax=Bionectria ochroleuca TaxID=29856 RepID=A0ABY6UH05_BIOOC|nr:unnamed protein product [Clonostachys rosea]